MLVNNDSDFDSLYESSAIKGLAKPLPVRLLFEMVLDNTEIKTLEGKCVVPLGGYIMTGLEGEVYAVSPSSFIEKYTDIVFFDDAKTKGGATKKVRPDTEYKWIKPNSTFQAKTWSGLLNGNLGDILIRYSQDDFGIIKPNLFAKLYETR